MAIKPKLEVRQYSGEGKKDYALFRADRAKPMCFGITEAHAEHLRIIVSRMDDIPETIKPIKEWFMYDEILSDEEIENLGMNSKHETT